MKKEKKYAKMTDGTEIYYEKSGNGMPLFLLHGNDGSGRFFSEQVPVFSQFYTVYLIDSRGHGRSTNQANTLSFRLMAEDLYTIMLLEGITKANILGFSDGANLGLVFSSYYPEKVHRLILNSGNTLVKGVSPSYFDIFFYLTIYYRSWLFLTNHLFLSLIKTEIFGIFYYLTKMIVVFLGKQLLL